MSPFDTYFSIYYKISIVNLQHTHKRIFCIKKNRFYLLIYKIYEINSNNHQMWYSKLNRYENITKLMKSDNFIC